MAAPPRFTFDFCLFTFNFGRAIPAFPGRRHFQRGGPGHSGETRWTDSRRFPGGLCVERAQHLLGRDRHLVDPDTDGVVDRIGDRRHDRQQRALPDFFGAERSARIRILDELSEHLGHVERRRALVLQHRRKLVHQGVRELRRQPAERLFLHQRFAERHVDAAFDLTSDERRIERTADVVRDPDARHMDPAGGRIDLDLDDGGGVGVGGRRPHAAALESGGRSRWRVRPGRAERAEHRFRQAHRLAEADPDGRVLRVEDAAFGEHEPILGNAQLLRYGVRQQIASALGGLNRGVAHHQGHAARIGTKIHRREIGIAGDSPDVNRIDAQHLRDARDEHVVRALADFRGAAERRDATAPIQFELHARVRHVVPVDRQSGAGEIRRAGEADTAAGRELAEPFTPRRRARDATNAFGQSDRADTQVVGGQRLRLFDDAEPKVGGIERQPLGNLVELNLLAEAALRRAVTALWSARRLVGEDTASAKLVGGDVIGHGLQCAGVEGAGDTVGAVGAAVQHRLHPHAGDRAVPLDAGLEAHQHRMPAAVAVEHLLAGQADLDRAIEEERGLADDDFVVERVALAAEAAAVRRRDDADVRRGHGERLGQRAMDVMRRLRARPQDELPVGVLRRDRGVLLDRQMRVAFVEEGVLEHVIGRRQRGLHIAEAERDELVDVPGVAVVVDAGRVVPKAIVRTAERPQRLVVDGDQIQRLEGGQFVARNHGRDRVADESHAVDGERVLVLADRQDAVRNRKVGAGEHEMDARVRPRA